MARQLVRAEHGEAGAVHLRVRQTTERLVELYEAWGKPSEAARWRAKLDDELAPATGEHEPIDTSALIQ